MAGTRSESGCAESFSSDTLQSSDIPDRIVHSLFSCGNSPVWPVGLFGLGQLPNTRRQQDQAESRDRTCYPPR
jgi:hypothetical protein